MEYYNYQQTDEALNVFDKTMETKITEAIVSHLEFCNLSLINQKIREEAKIILAKADALQKKRRHIDDMTDFLHKEVRDRESRRMKILTVRDKWQKSSRTFLSSNKSKWLLKVPKSWSTKTKKTCEYNHKLADSISGFDNYNRYNRAFSKALPFSSVLLFCADENIQQALKLEIFSEVSEVEEMSETEGVEVLDIETVMDEEEEEVEPEEEEEALDSLIVDETVEPELEEFEELDENEEANDLDELDEVDAS